MNLKIKTDCSSAVKQIEVVLCYFGNVFFNIWETYFFDTRLWFSVIVLHFTLQSEQGSVTGNVNEPAAMTTPLQLLSTLTRDHLAFTQPTSNFLEGWVGKKPSSTTRTRIAYSQPAGFQDGFANWNFITPRVGPCLSFPLSFYSL